MIYRFKVKTENGGNKKIKIESTEDIVSVMARLQSKGYKEIVPLQEGDHKMMPSLDKCDDKKIKDEQNEIMVDTEILHNISKNEIPSLFISGKINRESKVRGPDFDKSWKKICLTDFYLDKLIHLESATVNTAPPKSEIQSENPSAKKSVSGIGIIGGLLAAVGFLYLLGAMNMDVSVRVDGIGARVNNIGLMSERQNHMIVAVIITAFGVLMILARYIVHSRK